MKIMAVNILYSFRYSDHERRMDKTIYHNTILLPNDNNIDAYYTTIKKDKTMNLSHYYTKVIITTD
jgi:hypothetical protein